VVCRCVWSRKNKNPREWGGDQGPPGGYRAKREKKEGLIKMGEIPDRKLCSETSPLTEIGVVT